MYSSAKSAEWYRQSYTDLSTSGAVGASGTGSAGVCTTPSAKFTVYVQKITVHVQTNGQKITFRDSAGTPVVVATVPATQAADTAVTIDFGARGFALTEGKNLDLSNTATPVYSYSIEAYARQTSASSL